MNYKLSFWACSSFQFFRLSRLCFELGERTPAVECQHGFLLGYIATCEGTHLRVVQVDEVNLWRRFAVGGLTFAKEVRKCRGHGALDVAIPQKRSDTFAGREREILYDIATIVDGITVACRPAVGVVVQPHGDMVEPSHVAGVDDHLIVFLGMEVSVEAHPMEERIGRMEPTDGIQPTIHELHLVDEVELMYELLHLPCGQVDGALGIGGHASPSEACLTDNSQATEPHEHDALDSHIVVVARHEVEDKAQLPLRKLTPCGGYGEVERDAPFGFIR